LGLRLPSPGVLLFDYPSTKNPARSQRNVFPTDGEISLFLFDAISLARLPLLLFFLDLLFFWALIVTPENLLV